MAHTIARSLATMAVLSLATVGVTGTPAEAAPTGCKPIQGKPAYPPGQCKPKGIDPGTAAVCNSVTATSGEGQFDPRSTVRVNLHGAKGASLGTVTANANGEAVLAFKVPVGTPPGQYTVTFTGPFIGTTNSVTLNLKITTAGQTCGTGSGGGSGAGNGNGTGSGLPFTGFEFGMASVLGLGLIGGGTGIVIASRRRRDPAAA